MLRPEIGWKPVTSKFCRKEDSCGNVVVDELVLKMERQPRTVSVAEPGSTVQPLAPTYTRLLANAILVCCPSVIGIGVPAVKEVAFITVNAPQRESGHAAPGPVSALAPCGVPATYR